MNPEASPFTPGQPVPLEFFVGRISEVERLCALARTSQAGKLKVAFVAGERGIGKSSLVSYVRHLVERVDAAAGTHVFLGGVTDLEQMVRTVYDRMLKENIDKPWYGKLLEFFGSRVRKVGLFGASVELDLADQELRRLVDDFVPSLWRLSEKLSEQRKGLLIILDDINGLADSARFANWLKSTVDEIATSNRPLALCLVVVGLEDRRQTLIAHQPSLARIFDVVEIRPWTEEETTGFYQSSFEEKRAIKLEPAALKTMAHLTGGLPVIAHEIGDAVWRISEPPTVTANNALSGILQAADIIGRKFLQPQIFHAIRSITYRSILRKVADKPFSFSFKRSELWDRLNAQEQRVLDNFLRRMKKLGALLPDPEAGPGYYRFANQLHQVYFWLESYSARHESRTRS